MFDELAATVKRFGNLFRADLGVLGGAIVMINDPADLRVVLNSPHLAHKPSLFYGVMSPFFGEASITTNGDKYHRHRRTTESALHLGLLKEFVTTFNANSKELVSRLSPLADSGEVFDVSPLMCRYASYSVCQTVLATDMPDLDVAKDAFVDAAHDMGLAITHRCMRPWYAFEPLFWLIEKSAFHRYHRVIHDVSNYAKKILARKLAQVSAPASTAIELASKQRQTLLDRLLKSPESSLLNSSELEAELQTILVAGSVTSTDLLSFFFVCMSLEESVQKTIHDELDGVFGLEPDRDILAADLTNLKFLECALKETLRMFPPIPMLTREATRDVVLPSGSLLPKGVLLAISPLMLHRNPSLYPDPLKFDPQRFSPVRARERDPFAFLPFSFGARGCPGTRYGMLFAKTVAAAVLRRYRVLPDPRGPRLLGDLPLEGTISLAIHGGARIRLRPRLISGQRASQSRGPVEQSPGST